MAATTTTATTMVQLTVQPTPTETTPSSIPIGDQQVHDRLQTAIWRSGGTGRGGEGGGPPDGGPPGGGTPGGGGRAPGPAPTGQAPVQGAAPRDIRTMGTLPQIFTGNHAKAQEFMNKVLGYFHANRGLLDSNCQCAKFQSHLS